MKRFIMFYMFIVLGYSSAYAADTWSSMIYNAAKGLIEGQVDYYTSAYGVGETCTLGTLVSYLDDVEEGDAAPTRTVHNFGSTWDGLRGNEYDFARGLYVTKIDEILKRLPEEARIVSRVKKPLLDLLERGTNFVTKPFKKDPKKEFEKDFVKNTEEAKKEVAKKFSFTQYISGEDLYPYVKNYPANSPFFVYHVLKQYAKFYWSSSLKQMSLFPAGLGVSYVLTTLFPDASGLEAGLIAYLSKAAISRNIDFIAQMFALRHMTQAELKKVYFSSGYREARENSVCSLQVVKSALTWGQELQAIKERLEEEVGAINEEVRTEQPLELKEEIAG